MAAKCLDRWYESDFLVDGIVFSCRFHAECDRDEDDGHIIRTYTAGSLEADPEPTAEQQQELIQQIKDYLR